MRIITGDEAGLLKTTSLEAQRIVVAGTQTRARAVRALCWVGKEDGGSSSGGQQQQTYAAARQDGVVTVWEDSDKLPRLVTELKGAVGSDVVGLAGLGDGRLVAAHESGSVKVLSTNPAAASQDDQQAAAAAAAAWEATGPLSCMAVAGATLAAGGKERELGLWDAATGATIWEARNVPHDKLDLRQPVWVTAISFLDPTIEDPRTVAIATGYKQVRLYDARAQRRPVRQAAFEDHYRFTALCPGRQQGQQLVTGDAGGTVLHLDVGTLRVLGRLEGPAGSVRALARHPSLPFVAVAGLDRMARVYDLRRPRKPAFTYYLKGRLNACIFSAEGRKGERARGEEEEAARRAYAEGEGDDDVEGMEDDVGSLGSEEGEEDEEEDSVQRAGSRKEKKKGGGVSVQRLEEMEEEEEDSSSSSDEEEEEDEPIRPFGRRGRDLGANIELNITGGDDGDNDDDDDDDDNEEDEDEDEEEDESGESSSEEVEEGDAMLDDEEDEGGDDDEDEEEEPEPAPAPPARQTRSSKRARR